MFMSALRTTTALMFALLTASAALAGPPLATDDAGTVDVGSFEVEINGSYAYDKERDAGVTAKAATTDAELKFTTGLAKNLGIAVAVPYTIEAREKEDNALVGSDSGFGDMTLELKYAFAELAGINLAIKPALTLPTGKDSLSDGHVQYCATLIASKEFADGKYALHANLGYEHHRYHAHARAISHSNLWAGSVAGEVELATGLVVVADVGVAPNAHKGEHELPVYALTGARYEINGLLDINAGIKFGLTSPETDVTALYGVVLKF
jgi:hypothetical protein